MGTRAEAFTAAIDAANAGDYGPMLALSDPDVVFEPRRSAVQGKYLGPQGVEAFWADTTQTFDLFQLTYVDIREAGDFLVAIGTIRVRGRGSGVETTIPSAAVVEYRGEKVILFKDYVDAGQALAAAGIEG